MSIFSRKPTYELWAESEEDEEQGELVIESKTFIEKRTITTEVKSGNMDNIVYRLYEVRKGQDPILKWTKKKTVQKSSSEVSSKEREKLFNEYKERKEHLLKTKEEFDEFHEMYVKEVGSDGVVTNASPGKEIVIPDGVKTLKDAITIAFSNKMYTDLMSEPTGKTSKVIFDLLERVNQGLILGGRFIEMKMNEKRLANNKPTEQSPEKKKTVTKTEEKQEDGTVVTKYKREEKEEPVIEQKEEKINTTATKIIATPFAKKEIEPEEEQVQTVSDGDLVKMEINASNQEPSEEETLIIDEEVVDKPEEKKLKKIAEDAVDDAMNDLGAVLK